MKIQKTLFLALLAVLMTSIPGVFAQEEGLSFKDKLKVLVLEGTPFER